MNRMWIRMIAAGVASAAVFAVTEEENAKIWAAMPDRVVAAPVQPRTMLVFNLSQGYNHSSIPYWAKALDIMAEKTGAFTVEQSEDMAVFAPETLTRFDAICFNNTTGLKFNDDQKKALMDFVKGGKGIVGIHAATDNFPDWPEAQEMMGGVFTGHPWTHDGTWAVKIDEPEHPLMKSFGGKGFKVKDEIYRTAAPLYSRDKQRVLMSLDMSDEATRTAKGITPADMDTGISWIKPWGEGRVFYCSLGHNHHLTWDRPVLAHFLAGIQYALGDLKADDTPLGTPKAVTAAHPAADVYDGWRLGVQAWSFNRFTFFEAVDKVRKLGLSWIQAYPGQTIAPDIDVKLTYDLSGELRRKIKDKLAEANVAMIALGVVNVPREEAEARKLFAFAKEMGVEMIAAEPEFDQFDLIDRLAKEYQIKVGIHNHPRLSKLNRYWDPAIVLEVIENRSSWIGACADVGHWARSGLDPVECLRMLEGRIYDIHIKEVDTELGHDVVWGTGQGRINGILEELHRQGYQGMFTIEYEHNWDNNLPEIHQSVAYFNSIAAALKPSGWKPVFSDDLSNTDFKPDNWVYHEGVLERRGGGNLWTKAEYADFVLDCEYLLSPQTNSGIFVRAGNHEELPWLKVQVADSAGQPLSKHIAGAVFDIEEPKVNVVYPAGRWNRLTIWAKGPMIKVVLNNHLVQEIDLDDWTEAGKNPDGTPNKFDVAYKDLPRRGFLGFQDHGTKISYRNIRIKEL